MDAPLNDQWYYKNCGAVFGPVSVDSLIELARQRKIFPDDWIKLGQDGEWFLAGTVNELFAAGQDLDAPSIGETDDSSSKRSSTGRGSRQKNQERRPPMSQKGASGAAFDVLSRIHFRQFESADKAKGLGIIAHIAEWRDSIWGASSDRITTARDFIVEKLALLRSLASLKLVLVVVCVLLLGALFRLVPWQWTPTRSAEETYADLWTELKAHREAGSDDATWADFSLRANEELKPIVRRLEKTATAKEPRTLSLLWAGRDYFPSMLGDARHEVSESERKFELQLAAAERPRKTVQQKSPARELTTVGILAIDACVLVAFAVFVFIKRR